MAHHVVVVVVVDRSGSQAKRTTSPAASGPLITDTAATTSRVGCLRSCRFAKVCFAHAIVVPLRLLGTSYNFTFAGLLGGTSEIFKNSNKRSAMIIMPCARERDSSSRLQARRESKETKVLLGLTIAFSTHERTHAPWHRGVDTALAI